MSENTQPTVAAAGRPAGMTTKTLAYCALLAALGVVMARLFSLPPILYGLCGGLFRAYLGKKVSLLRLLLAILSAVILGSILWQSFALTYVYFKDGPFMEGFLLRLGTRSVQFAVTMVIDVVIVELLFKSKLFHRMGVWPPTPKKAKPNT